MYRVTGSILCDVSLTWSLCGSKCTYKRMYHNGATYRVGMQRDDSVYSYVGHTVLYTSYCRFRVFVCLAYRILHVKMSIPCIRMSGIPYSTRHNVDSVYSYVGHTVFYTSKCRFRVFVCRAYRILHVIMSIPYIRMSCIPYSTRHNVDFNITTFTLMELARLSSHMKMVRQMMSEYTRLYTLYVTNRDMYCTYVLTPLQAHSLRYVEHRIFF